MLTRNRLRNAFKISAVAAIAYLFLISSNDSGNRALAQITPGAGGATRIFMQFGDIKGSSTDDRHKDWIELRSCQWGFTHTSTGGMAGGVRGTREREISAVADVSITKAFDASSTALVQDALKGSDVKVTIEFLSAGERGTKPYLKITLEGASVATYNFSAGGERPTESLTLNYNKITFADDNNKPSHEVVKGR